MQRKLRIWSSFSCSDNRKSAIQKRPRRPKWLGFSILAFVLVVAGAAAEAQQPGKIFRVGYLAAGRSGPPQAFLQGLRDLGYVEGKNIILEYRAPEEKSGRFTYLAPELVRLKVDVIVAEGAGAIRAAKNASATIPIVMAHVNDPIVLGLVASLAHPGGNITGNSNLSPELSGKRVELLKEVLPRMSRLAVLAYRADSMRTSIKETEVAAQSLHLQVQLLEVKEPDEIESAFDAAKKQRADALVQIEAALFAPHQQRIVDLATKARLPAVHNNRADVEAGGLMSYGPDRVDMNRRAASFVDKILKGAKPADLPVEQPRKFEFVVNLKTAKQIGLTVPSNVLARADKVVR
jgi:putative tryptophan/tyrosine transport system substrate-binding protein